MKRYVLGGLLAIVGVLAILMGLLAATLYEESKSARTDVASTATTTIATISSNAVALLIQPKLISSSHKNDA